MQDPYKEPVEDAAPKWPEMPKPPAEKLPPQENLSAKPAEVPAQEKIKPAISYQPPVGPPAASPPPKETGAPDLKGLSEDRQLSLLIDMALKQGIEKAVEAAKATNNAYLIDKLHDTLVDELRQQLIEKGKLKET